jgi:hypothetical protein
MNNIPYISVQPCPVCGEAPEFNRESLSRPGGHGYTGCYTYGYECGFCKLVKGRESDDIYSSPEEAKNRAKKYWNEEVDRIHNHLRKQWVPKVLVEYDII